MPSCPRKAGSNHSPGSTSVTAVSRYSPAGSPLNVKRPSVPGRVAEMAWARLRLAEALVNRADAERGHRERSAWIAEARRLFATVQRADGGASVTAGSPPGFHELFDQMRARLASPLG